jgi:hypothetical protein
MAGKLIKMRVTILSLVDKAANNKGVIIKSSDAKGMEFESQLTHLRKDAQRGLLYGTVYEPDVTDSQGDWAPVEVIEDCAHEFLSQGLVKMVDSQHNLNPVNGTVVESFIKNGSDTRFPDSKDGSWCVAIKMSSETLAKIDGVHGISLYGAGKYEDLQKQDREPVGPFARFADDGHGIARTSTQPMARIAHN